MIWQALLAGAAVAVLALSWHEVRARYWIAAMAVNFTLCTLYQSSGLPHYPFVVGLLDAGLCLTIYFVGAYRWEMALYRIFQGSVLVSILRFSDLIETQYQYVTALEIVNWLALLVIGGTAIAQRSASDHDNIDSTRHPVHRVRPSLCSLCKKRKTPSFLEAKH